MKHSLLLLVSVCLISLASCQKKQYAHFQNSASTEYAHKNKNAVTKVNEIAETQSEEIAIIAEPTENFSASNAEVVVPVAETTTTVAERADVVESKAVSSKATVKTKMTFAQKVKAVKQIRKLSKQISKNSATAANPKAANSDTLALIALIAGVAGLILMFASGIIGLLLGIGAIILGAVSLKSTNKRGMAITGIVLGSLTILIFLIAIIFVAALIAAI